VDAADGVPVKHAAFALVVFAILGRATSARAEPPASASHLTGFASGGVGFGRIFSVPTLEGQFALGLGGRWSVDEGSPWQIGFYVTSEYAGGSTQYGLGTNAFRFGPALDVSYAQRLHLGGGFEYARLIIQRKTSSDTLDYGGIGAFALVAVDVVRFEPGAVFVSVRASGDAMTDRALRSTISLASGIRF
jgi:hypothetical protein